MRQSFGLESYAEIIQGLCYIEWSDEEKFLVYVVVFCLIDRHRAKTSMSYQLFYSDSSAAQGVRVMVQQRLSVAKSYPALIGAA